jgi:sialidase-1
MTSAGRFAMPTCFAEVTLRQVRFPEPANSPAMNRLLSLLPALWPVLSLSSQVAAEPTYFVKEGVPILARTLGSGWTRGDGYLECQGTERYMYARKALGVGDFHVTAQLTIQELARSAASFCIDDRSHFGFEGASGVPFLSGPLFARNPQIAADKMPLVQPGRPFTFEFLREKTTLRVLIDGDEVYRTTVGTGPLGTIAFRPWRSRMQISEFKAEGALEPTPPPRTQPIQFTIPLIDLSAEKQRQVIVESIPGQYLGHPTTVLLADGKTILCTYPLGHGGPAAVLKKSVDGGLTWSERLPVPENWATATNCPCLHRLTGPDGVERLLVVEGGRDLRQSVSLDNGKTWTPFAPNGLHGIVAPITIVPISGGRHLAVYHQGHEGQDRSPLTICQAISKDGGLTWEDERQIAAVPFADPCEPAVIRSPDGKQLLCLMRENARRYNSLMMLSDDEGRTWSTPVELPASLTGDRHMPRYSRDGRLVIAFRDMAEGSPTRGDFVAWVGTYEDIVKGREGQYRLRLLNSPTKGDLGYPGLELLPDDTFVATTYAVLNPGEKQSVVSIRFSLREVDEKAAELPVQEVVFRAGEEGYHTFRIPSLLVTPRGAVLAFCEGRKSNSSDTGDIDLVLKRSTDGGKTFGPLEVLWDDGPHTCGNPCPVVDRDTGTLWLLLTHNLGQDRESAIIDGTSEGTRTVWVTHSEDDGVSWARPQEITQTTKAPNWTWYATGPGVGIQLRSGRLVIPCDNVVAGTKAHQSHVIYSDDHGESWKLGGVVGELVNECQVAELADGRLLMNMRNGAGSDSNLRAIATSADGGLIWSKIEHDPALVEPVCQASLIAVPDPQDAARRVLLFSNPAGTNRQWMTMKASDDGGRTWPAARLLFPGPAAYSCLGVLPDGSVGCLYERGSKHPYETIVLARARWEWLRTPGTL